jgi:hypothetical protein
MVRKNRLRLFAVGVLMVTSVVLAAFIPYFWAPGIILGLTGLYLVIWATLGRGYWCRTCKKIGVY